jgi:hypothetical protein
MPPPLPEPELDPARPTPRGLGGWLLVVALGLFATPIRVVFGMVGSSGTYQLMQWNVLTVPGASAYHPLWAPALISSLLSNLTIVVFALLLIVLFLEKRRTFPRLFICYMALGAVAGMMDACFLQAIPNADHDPREISRAITRTAVGCGIWIPYMCVSRRVRATFVN